MIKPANELGFAETPQTTKNKGFNTVKITNNTTSSGVFSQQPPVRLAEIPRKCANCHRIFGDEVEYGGKSPTDGVVLCADCFDFAKGKEVKP